MAIIIVGNGPSILNAKRGKLIDSFKTVIRINDYILKGYEEFTGTKTDIWAMDTRNFWLYDQWLDRYKTIPEIWVLPSIAYIKSHTPIEIQLRTLHNNFYVAPRTQAIALRVKLGAYASTGMATINYALQKFPDVKPIDIIGFDHFAGEKCDYWDKKKKVAPHNSKREREFVSKLINEGRLRRL